MLASAVALFSVAAWATPVSTISQNYNLGGDTTWREDRNGVQPPVLTLVDKGYAGSYNVRINNGPIVQAFCIDLFLGIAVPGSYDQNLVSPTSNTLSDMTRVSRAAWIFSDVFPNIAALATANNTNQQTIAVALQFAIWETMVDSATSFNLNAGFFQRAAQASNNYPTNVDYTKAVQIAAGFGTTYAGAVNTNVANRSVILVDTRFNLSNPGLSTNTQRLITFVGDPVPEPATMVLFGSALTALGLLARRRKS
ncbi:MAG: Cys-Gln thioester bond-forming surface protein [Bryobacteraceae bacterium]|nr:Cys-Gln thioester bond-forming surface protein [Bryobacteraceae bacterium]